MIKYVVLRFFLWLVGVFVSLFPTLYSLGAETFAADITLLAARINEKGQLRDILFVLVTISVLEISLLCDFLYVQFNVADKNLAFIAIILLVTNCVTLGASLVGFTHLPPEGRIAHEWIIPVLRLAIGGAGAGLFTEVTIACANHYLGAERSRHR